MSAACPTATVVLVGAGHAHLEILRRADRFARAGVKLVLVAPDDFLYSGMAPGVVGGFYPPGAARVPLAPLTGRHGVAWVRARVEVIDPAHRVIFPDSHESISYDWLSLNVGSVVDASGIEGADRFGTPVKPVEGLLRLAEEVGRRLEGEDRAGSLVHLQHVCLIGGGASACEVAACLQGRAERSGRGDRLSVTVIAGGGLLPGWGARAGRLVGRVLGRHGVGIGRGVTVARVGSRAVVLASGDEVPLRQPRRSVGGGSVRAALSPDRVLIATGLAALPLLRASGLPVDDRGFLRVDATLRSVGDARVFGAGDCIAFDPKPLPRAGVHAVRQGRLLAGNLLAAATGRPLRPYRPPRWILQILNLGDGTGLAAWGPFAARGRWAWWLKDRIDRRYMRSFGVEVP